MMGCVNTDVRLDPDFGTKIPMVGIIYSVEVKPVVNKPYTFLLFMPIINPSHKQIVIRHAMDMLLEEDDHFVVRSCADDEHTKITKSTIVASFLPEKPDVFIFLMPPEHLRS